MVKRGRRRADLRAAVSEALASGIVVAVRTVESAANRGQMPAHRKRPSHTGRSTNHRLSPRQAAAWLAELLDLRAQFSRSAAERKLALLAPAVTPTFRDPDQLVECHDVLLFLRTYPDNRAVLAAAERRLRAFSEDVARYCVAARDPSAAGLLDSGLVGSSAVHVVSFRLARALAQLHPRAVEIDWDSYYESDTANIPCAIVPAMLWNESDAVDNDEAFNERAWLEQNRTRRDPTCLRALLRLFATSGLPERVQENLYDMAEIPVRWDLTTGKGSRTHKRVPGLRPFLQRDPLRERTRDLRSRIAPPAAPCRRVSGARGRRYVAAIHEVLAARVRELYPLAGATPDEVYLYEPGRGLQVVIYGSVPAVRLPHESNMGAMFVRNGVPVGYGLAAFVFDHAEMAINLFPAYRAGESAFVIEEFFRLVVHHFGARQLAVSSYQVGDGNDEGLDSGSFWFYYKLGFRPVRKAVFDLAERERARVEADPAHRTSRAMLKRLAKSDLFFHLDPAKMDGHEAWALADLGYALTRHVVGTYGGDRTAAVEGAIERLAARLPLGDLRRWTDGERLGLQRLAPLFDALGSLERWPAEDRVLLARLLRAKGGTGEREFIRLAQRLPRLEAALRQLARREARRRALRKAALRMSTPGAETRRRARALAAPTARP